MGCAGSVPNKTAPDSAKQGETKGDIMLRADGTVRELNAEQDKAQKLKAQQSAARLAAMMAELGLGDEYKLPSDQALVGALQPLVQLSR